MKRRMTLSIALTLSVVALLLASSDSTAQPKPGIRRVADTGIVSLGPNQVLRLTLFGDATGDRQVDAADYVVFRRMEYIGYGFFSAHLDTAPARGLQAASAPR